MSLLFNTKIRKKLLAYSFTHSDKEYYVRELAELIDEDAGNLSRELRRLEKEGLYRSSARGGLKLYSLNKKYPLYEEIKKIIFKTEGVEGALKRLISQYEDISLAFIYGSYAKKKERRDSDIDLLLVGSFPVDAFTRKIRELESKIGREINFTYYGGEEFKKERLKEGAFLNMISRNKVILLKGALDGK